MKRTINIIALVLVIIGAINWGLVGLFQFDLVAWIFGGPMAMASRVVYVLVAIAGLWCISVIVDQARLMSYGSVDAERRPRRQYS